MTAIINYHKFVGLNNRNFFSLISVAQKKEKKKKSKRDFVELNLWSWQFYAPSKFGNDVLISSFFFRSS